MRDCATDRPVSLSAQAEKVKILLDQLAGNGEDDDLFQMIEILYLEIGRLSKAYSRERLEWEEKFARLSDERNAEAEVFQEKMLAQKAEVEALREDRVHLKSLLEFRDRELERLENETAALIAIADEMEVSVESLLNSKRWQMGDSIGEWKRKLLFRPREPLTAEHLRVLIEMYRSWKDKFRC